MIKTRVVVLVLLADERSRRNARRYLSTIVPASYPIILLVEGQQLTSRDLDRLSQADRVLVVSSAASLTPGWLDELLVISGRYPEAVIVPGSPNVNGPQRQVLEESQHIVTLAEQAEYASHMRRAFAGTAQPISYASDLVACAAGAWVQESCTSGPTTSFALFSSLYRHRALVLAQGSIAFSSEVKTKLIPGAPTTTPLLSLCMIVKDEESCLVEALLSVRDLVDEMIVFDTGSTDATVRIARQHGARVIEGEWREDFAWARNQTLNYATGAWILWIDADERVVGDRSALRLRLEDPLAPYEAYSVRIENATGGGLSLTNHFANRLFRRKDCYWRGAIHETVWYRDDQRSAYSVLQPDIHLRHIGYLDTEMTRKSKAERNLRISEVNGSAASEAEAALHEARSMTMSGRLEEAVALVEEQVLGSGVPLMERVGMLAISFWYRALGRYEQAEWAIEQLSEHGFHEYFGFHDRAHLAFAQGQFEEALHWIDAVGGFVVDRDGLTVNPTTLLGLKARALAALGRDAEAARVIIAGLAQGVMDVHLAELAGFMERGGVDVAELLAALPDDKEQLVAAQLLQVSPQLADRLLTELIELRPDDRTLLAAASLVGRHLEIERASYWSRVLIEHGLGQQAPVVWLATNAEVSIETRMAAAKEAVALGQTEVARVLDELADLERTPV
ncbi:glycosyltransferase family 2 protein [Ferrimicrobium sp.]|uniref:tetratricopeptide repeat-containing glycosyltransferase family 2 protein n=1 Tax=Ferrimicrobium sp. TaxID=2926050 RepID=UPI002615C69B|nr:glycosyltransferase family 2 protein [Ferrimicrobium sp.]